MNPFTDSERYRTPGWSNQTWKDICVPYTMKFIFLNIMAVLLWGCNSGSDHYIPKNSRIADTSAASPPERKTSDESGKIIKASTWDYSLETQFINTGNTKPDELVDYAETLKGVPYLYGSIDPQKGFDCSGFITHVFNRFDIQVPRSSKDFTSVEREINLNQAKRGDIILFTGTDSTKRVVGHMGIITGKNSEGHEFIHSTSGKAYSVTVTPLNGYYQGRFLKVLRIFRDNDM